MSICNGCRYQLTNGHELCVIFPTVTCKDIIKKVFEIGECKEFKPPISYIDPNNYIKVTI